MSDAERGRISGHLTESQIWRGIISPFGAGNISLSVSVRQNEAIRG